MESPGEPIFVRMGFHSVSMSSDEWNIVVDDNGCFKTDKSVAIDTELVWKAVGEN